MSSAGFRTATLKNGGARWAFIAATSKAATERFAGAQGIEPQVIVTAPELLQSPIGQLRALASRCDYLAIHSLSWRRQACPQVYELLLALAPVRARYIVDEELDSVRRMGIVRLAGRMISIPVALAAGMGMAGVEVTRHLWLRRCTRRSPETIAPPFHGGGGDSWVMAIWPGSPEAVGGSVSHTTGILLAIRRAGFKVALVASVVPPAQLLAAADDVDVIEPSPPRSRVTRRLAKLSTNARFRRAALAVGIRRRPQFVYQRNDYLLAAGADVAARLGIPLVLEWNCSEVWVNAHWRRPGPLDAVVRPVVEPLAVSFESGTVLAAAVIAAVSRPAADMALERGASPERVMVVPNGVDLGVIPGTPLRRGHTDAAATRIGWIGSFGPWHGVEVLIRALALLPPPIHLTLIGEGIERESCVALARSLGVDDRIEWTGRLGHGSALARLAACDVLVSPHVPLPDTPFFGSPTKIFEYMALGKPIVASRLEQLGELLEDGRTARLVTPGDPAELAQAILDVITSADQGRGLGTEARREVEAQHTWDHRAVAILRKVGWRSVEPSSDPSGGTWPCDVSLP